jgi:hypothetical protein
MNIFLLFLRPGARETKERSGTWTGPAICHGCANQTPATHLSADQSYCIRLDLPAVHQSSKQGADIHKVCRCTGTLFCLTTVASHFPLACLTFKIQIIDHSLFPHCISVRLSVLYELPVVTMQIPWEWNVFLYVTYAEYGYYKNCHEYSDKIFLMLLF